jgi:hypothetical protein
MTYPINQQLLHALHGNTQLAHGFTMRFAENAPVLMQIFSSAWERGDEDAVHGSSFRLLSHLRVMGMQDAVQALERLTSTTTLRVHSLSESEDWKVLEQGIQSVLI